MACFLVPAAEAVATTIAKKVIDSKEKKEQSEVVTKTAETDQANTEIRLPISQKLRWLNYMLWGGSALLAFEHVWHGEVTPWFPFLTAAGNPSDMAVVLHETATVGVSMALAVTGIWAVMVFVTGAIERRGESALPVETEEGESA